MMQQEGTTAPIELPSGELIPTAGVLYIKPNGTGILVKAENNYVPQPGDPIVPRSMIDRLHLQSGLHLAGSARRAGNNLEFVGLEQVEGLSLEDFPAARRAWLRLKVVDLKYHELSTEGGYFDWLEKDGLFKLGQVKASDVYTNAFNYFRAGKTAEAR